MLQGLSLTAKAVPLELSAQITLEYRIACAHRVGFGGLSVADGRLLDAKLFQLRLGVMELSLFVVDLLL